MRINFKDARFVIDRHMLADGMSPVIDLERSHGSWLVDGVTGKEYLDLFSMYASMSVGYNHPYIMDSICLLYTSPSPRDATLSRMPSSA